MDSVVLLAVELFGWFVLKDDDDPPPTWLVAVRFAAAIVLVALCVAMAAMTGMLLLR